MTPRPAHESSDATVPNAALVLDLLEWLADGQRPYPEVMAAWRTSCPRLSVWEDALAMDYVRCVRARDAVTAWVRLTDEGRRFLEVGRPA
jgi:hypothetical protein